MRIGYACLNVTLATKMRTCRLKTVELEGMAKVKELTIHNLNEVKRIMEWNIENDIHFFRVSSDIVPFGSHEILTWDWWEDEDVLTLTRQIHSIREENHFRLSVHPGQYTIINSPNEKVVKNAIRELDYHNKLISLVGGTDMVIHVGGVYGDKETAKKRFIDNYQLLSDEIKEKLIVENDDKSFHLSDVIDISEQTGAPICFDIHHHNCNPSFEGDIESGMNKVFASWEGIRLPKMHISSGKRSKTDTSHHDFIFKEDFDNLLHLLNGRNVDIMFEAKMKEKSVLNLREKS